MVRNVLWLSHCVLRCPLHSGCDTSGLDIHLVFTFILANDAPFCCPEGITAEAKRVSGQCVIYPCSHIRLGVS